MTYRISKTVLERCDLGDFAARAAAHAVAMKDWRAHMALVKNDEDKDVPAIERHMPFPRPIEHELVEAAVNERDEMDYKVVDDGPTPDQVLQEKKSQLLLAIAHAETAALETIVPAGKRRLLNMQHNDIRAADMERAAKIVEGRGKMAKAVTAVGLISAPDLEAEVAKARPAEETEQLDRHAEREKKFAAIHRAAAQAAHDVEELTPDNIDSWKAPDFKESKE